MTLFQNPATIPEPEITIQDHANETVQVVFMAFGLIALMIFASAAYLIVQIFKGNIDTNTLMILSVTGFMVAIVLLAGYYILSVMAASIV